MASLDKRVAVVTGANKGIGFEICRQLADRGLRVVLTSRDLERGLQAHAALSEEGLDVVYHQLDVDSDESVTALAAKLDSVAGVVSALVTHDDFMLFG